MIIQVNDTISLSLIEEKHASAIFELVDKNREHLKTWLPFAQNMLSLNVAHNFVKGTMQRNKTGNEFAFVILEKDIVIGRIGIYKIDEQNKTGEIGYWLAENAQGRGIVTKSCNRLIEFAFMQLNLNRLEIRCGTGNLKSMAVPERLNFTKESVIRQGELLYDKFIDLNLYALVKCDYNPSTQK